MTKALKWYLLAAEGGKVTAKHNLILMYEEGRITRADIAPLFATSNEGLGRMSPDDFLVQVIVISSRVSLDKYLQVHRSAFEQQPVQVVSINSKGRDVYLLLLGPFSELDHAQAAKDALPPAVSKEGAWIRKVSSVQAVAY
jgi:septal ring-binding cell division protein DamX